LAYFWVAQAMFQATAVSLYW